MTRQESWPAGTEIARQGETCHRAVVIESGKIRLYRKIGTVTVPIALLGPGDILSAECLFKEPPLNYSAVTVVDTIGISITPLDYVESFENVPEWLRRIVRSGLERERVAERPVRSSVSTLYSVCTLLYSFLRVHRSENTHLRITLSILLDELINTMPLSRGFIHPVLVGLSQAGLIDLKVSDPYAEALAIPDESLFLGFLHFLQQVAHMHGGLLADIGSLQPADLDDATSRLLDLLLMEPDYSERIFLPDRAMVHLRPDSIDRMISKQGGASLDTEAALDGFVEWGVVKRMKDGEHTSLFLDLRSLLRLNILRDPETSYIDMIDFLLSLMYDARFEPADSVSLRSL